MKLFRLGYFKTYLLLKQICGDFEVLGITRLFDLFARVLIVIPGDVVCKSVLNFVVKPFINPQTLSQFQLLP